MRFNGKQNKISANFSWAHFNILYHPYPISKYFIVYTKPVLDKFTHLVKPPTSVCVHGAFLV